MDNYPKDPRFRENFGPRGVMHCWATDKDDKTVQPRWGKVGKQKIKDTGPLTKKRMETCDDEFVAAATRLHQAAEQGRQALVRVAQHHAHAPVHAHQEAEPRAGRPLAVAVPRHDDRPRQERRADARPARRPRHRRGHLRPVLDRQRSAPQLLARWRHDAVQQREEHQLGRRVPHTVAGPLARQGQGRLGLQRHRPASRLAADLPRDGGGARCGGQAEEGLQGDRPHVQEPHRRLQLPAVPHGRGQGRARASSSSTSATTATCWRMRYDNWKLVFMEQRMPGTMRVWAEPFTRLRMPKLFNLRTDPYEFADITSNSYYEWFLYNAYFIYAAQAGRGEVRRDLQGVPAGAEAEHLHRRRRDWRRCTRRWPARAEPCWQSWNDGAAKSAIVDFVARVTREGGRDYVPPAERIATFDNDGTLWCEQPVQVQVFFLIDRVKQLAAKDPSLSGAAALQGAPRGRPQDAACARETGRDGALCRDAHRHDGGGVRPDRTRLVRRGEASEARASLQRNAHTRRRWSCSTTSGSMTSRRSSFRAAAST